MKTNEFWLLAEKAIRDADSAKSENEKRVLLELAHIWTQAAAESEGMSLLDRKAM